MIYAHEELMHELGLHQSELPNHIAVQYRAFAQKKRLSTKPEALEKLIETSEELADEIATWHVAYVSEDEDEEEDEEDEDPAPAPIIKKEKTQIVTHVSNNEIEDDEEEEDEERDERWGSKRGNW